MLTQSSTRGPAVRVRLPRIGPNYFGDCDIPEADEDVAFNLRTSGAPYSTKLLSELLQALEKEAASSPTPTPGHVTALSPPDCDSIAGENDSALSEYPRSNSPDFLHPSLGVNTPVPRVGPLYEELVEAFQLRLKSGTDVDEGKSSAGKSKEDLFVVCEDNAVATTENTQSSHHDRVSPLGHITSTLSFQRFVLPPPSRETYPPTRTPRSLRQRASGRLRTRLSSFFRWQRPESEL